MSSTYLPKMGYTTMIEINIVNDNTPFNDKLDTSQI